MKLRHWQSYFLKAAGLLIFIGVIVMLLLLLKDYTTQNPSTKKDNIKGVNSWTYLLAPVICNIIAVIFIAVYLFLILKKYAFHRFHIKQGRVYNIYIVCLIMLLGSFLSFAMMGYTYSSINDKRNIVSFVFLSLIFLVLITSIGFEQWVIYKIEFDIANFNNAKEIEDKKREELDKKIKGSNNDNSLQSNNQQDNIKYDDDKASANPNKDKKN